MSAIRDRDQEIRFHYGIANVELAHMLPADEAHVQAPANPYTDIFALLDQNERALKQLTQSRAKLSFLIADLKRLLT